MVDNELVLLDQVLQQRQSERTTPLRDDDAFEIFACEQVLREQDLSPEEVALGVIGGSNDGAIDGIFVFLGESLLAEDHDIFQSASFSPTSIASGTTLRLWLIQAKTETSFTESAIDKISNSTSRLLNLGEVDSELEKLYSPSVVTATGLFRTALRRLATRHLKVEIHFSYVTRGRTKEINAKVEIKARDLEKKLSQVVTDATASVNFLGAAELWSLTNSVPSYTTELRYQENATGGSSHVALVKLRDYVRFLSTESGGLKRHIFDLNVRDYQGDVEVNKEIRDSLLDESGPEFWWLNNGVTIVCSKTSIVDKTYILDDVQIVNGLQTSHTIHRVLRDVAEDHPSMDRSVLVRILVTKDDPVTRDRVIRATNRQTQVPAASLRATDEIQRNIESYFLASGWFYDRRKNFYRNSGKSPERIVGIPLLAQAVMAMGLSRPDNSRARPSSLLKRNDDYARIFTSKIPLKLYLWFAQSQKEVDSFLSTDPSVTTQEKTNLRFHLSMIATTKLLGRKINSPIQLKAFTEAPTAKSILDADLTISLKQLKDGFKIYQAKTGDASDKIAKGSGFIDFIITYSLSDNPEV